MGTGAITSYFDLAQLVLYLFWIFFFGLVYYLVRENHREGYPMDADRGIIEGWPRAPAPKTFRMSDGSEVQVPRDEGLQTNFSGEKVYRGTASPLEPAGDPFAAGVGPGAWAQRVDKVDLDFHGQPKIVPLSMLPECNVSDRGLDPRGMTVYDGRGDAAGTVRDLWIDRSEMMFRYLDVEVPLPTSGTRRVLVPMTFARCGRDGVDVHALMADQFAGVPAPVAADRLTLLEEERITAYFGAGLLYAEPHRTEPLV
jgi:photosynthetic reaction center H subunit